MVECLGQRGLERVWLHVDFDVLDEAVIAGPSIRRGPPE